MRTFLTCVRKVCILNLKENRKNIRKGNIMLEKPKKTKKHVKTFSLNENKTK